MKDLAFRLEQQKQWYFWIYGAGIVGERALNVLTDSVIDLKIEGFVVSDKTEEKNTYLGYPVATLTDVMTPAEQTIFIVAVSEKYAEDIVDNLKKNGFHNYYLYNAQLKEQVYMFADYEFVDRRNHSDKAFYILAGYKEFLWEDVFGRMVQFLPKEMDVCILSSGLYNEKLECLAEKNGWSYLHTKINSISLIQNIFMYLYRDAQWYMKIDEDIFLTENIFEKLLDTYKTVLDKEPYQIGFVAPLLNVNGYGYIRLLDKLNLRDSYEQRFDKVLYGGHSDKCLESDAGAAQFMWGATGEVPVLDVLNRKISAQKGYSFCNVRFSIGCILFHRSFWDEIKCFEMGQGHDLGVDEITICKTCMIQSYAIVVAEHAVVGHFSFGKQTEEMKQFYVENPQIFKIQ